jgi:hypothetical protein
MNDDFIYRALPKVRKNFAQSLYAKISVDGHRSSRAGRNPLRRIPRRWQAAIFILGVLLLVAWSQIRLWIRYVPIGNLWLIEFSSLTQQVPSEQIIPPVIPTSEDISIYTFDPPYPVPDWIPDGFSATTIPGPGYSYEDSIGMWRNDDGKTIRLFAVPKSRGARPYAPPGLYKEVRVNGQPAILVFGRLAPNSAENPQAQRQWDKTLGLQLSWGVEHHIFTLETLGPYITEDDLIRMAESIP